jgi:hypothetical protein
MNTSAEMELAQLDPVGPILFRLRIADNWRHLFKRVPLWLKHCWRDDMRCRSNRDFQGEAVRSA